MCFKNFFYLLEVIWRENFVLGKLINGFFVYGNDYINWSLDYVIDGIV